MVELIPELQTEARDRLKALGYGNIRFRLGDCWRGRPKEAPFDAVIVTPAPAILPPALTAQLAPGGRLLAPVGRQHETRFLTRILRREDGELEEERGLAVAFVPLVKTE